jgi:hypothetical protein
MADPNWKNGFYYDGLPPHTGMKLARREFVAPTAQAFADTSQKSLPSHIDPVPNGTNVLGVSSATRRRNNPPQGLVSQHFARTF